MTTLRRLLSTLVHARPADEAEVHFHRGPNGSPAVCHEVGCAMPRLEV